MSRATWAVVVNWNGGEAVLACLDSLVANGVPEARIVVVDNASTDGSADAIAAARPQTPLLRNATNTGYGHATNTGIEHALAAGADRVLLVNDDVTFPEGSVALLEAGLDEDAGVGIVGPRVVYRDEPRRLWAAGGTLTFRANLSRMHGHGQPDAPRWRSTREVDYVPGCALLARREVFEQAGLLDGDYFAYHEDLEFCLKAKEAGHRVVVVGEALALHAAHSSTGGGYNPGRKYMMGVNTVWFLRRHGTPLRWASFLLFDVLSLPFVWLYRLPRGEGAAVVAKARGIRDGLLGRRVTGTGPAS